MPAQKRRQVAALQGPGAMPTLAVGMSPGYSGFQPNSAQ